MKSSLFTVRLTAVLMCVASLLTAAANFIGGRLTLGIVILALAIVGTVSAILGWVRRRNADDPTFTLSVLGFLVAFATNGIASPQRLAQFSGWLMALAAVFVLVGQALKWRKRRAGEAAAGTAAGS